MSDELMRLRDQLITTSIRTSDAGMKEMLRKAADAIRNLDDEVDNLRCRNTTMAVRIQRMIREHEQDSKSGQRLHNGG